MGKIVSLDLSLTCTGYNVANTKWEILETGTIKTYNKNKLDKRLEIIWDKLKEIKHFYNPELVLIEKGFSRFNTATQQIFRVHGITNLVFSGIEQIYYAPTTIKKTVTGSGKASKEQVRRIVKEIYPNVSITNDDIADSVALLLHHKSVLEEKQKKGAVKHVKIKSNIGIHEREIIGQFDLDKGILADRYKESDN